MKKFIVLLLLTSFAVFAAAPKKFTNDVLQFGGGANGSLKEIIFNTGAGVNPSIGANSADGSLLLRPNDISIGDAQASNKNMTFDVGLGVNNPKLFWDNASGAISFTNDGSIIKKIGSGSGAGGGENFNNGFTSSDNANAEDGATAWTVSGGTFATTLVDPLEGEQSFTYAPAAQNNYIESSVLSFDKDVFRGQACEARIEYIGGDANLTLQVVDGTNAVIASQALQIHSIFGQESAFFLCPNQTDITANALKGNLRYRITNTGVAVSPLIKWDKSYVGTLRGLTEMTLPDYYTVVFGAGATIISGNEQGIMSGCSESLGITTCSLSGYTIAPGCHVSLSGVDPALNQTYNTECGTSSNSLTFKRQYVTGGSSASSIAATVTLINQGADAKQTVQVYKSIPKAAQNENSWTAQIDPGSGSLLDQNVNWTSNSNVVNTGVGTAQIIFNTPLINRPSCTAQAIDSSGTKSCNINNSFTDNTQVYVSCTTTNTGASTTTPFNLKCDKQGSDYKTPTVQPIVVGQVQSSYATSTNKNVRIESCRYSVSGTVLTTDNKYCPTWISSVTRNAIGEYDFTVKAGTFGGQSSNLSITCWFAQTSVTAPINATGTINPFFSPNVIRMAIRVNSGTVTDVNGVLVCMGDY